MSPGSGDSSTDASTEPEPLRVAHDTAAAAAPTTSDATATDASAAAPDTTPDTGAADEGSSTDTSAPEASDAADAATATGTDATLDTSAAAGPAEPDTGAAPTDAAAADTSDATTGTTDASAAPAAAVDPTSGPADPAPAPEAWAVDLADGSAHTVSIASDGTNLLVTVDGVTDSRPLESVSSVAVTGGDGGDDVTVDSSIAATGIPVSVDGREGSDTYRVGGDFDKLSLTADSTDTLDLAGASDTIGHPDDATFTSSSGGTLTVSGDAPQIDVHLADPEGFKNGVRDAIGAISTTIGAVASTAPELTTPLPLLDSSAGAGIEQLSGLGSSFQGLAASVDASFADLAPTRLSDVVHALTLIGPSLPQLLRGLVFSSAYASSNGSFLVFVRLRSTRSDPSTCADGVGCTRKAVALSVSGVQLDGDSATPGVQAPTLDVGAAVGVDLAAGVNLTDGGAFVDPSGTIAVAVDAANRDVHASATQGAEQASVSGAVEVGGAVVLTLSDPTPGDDGIALDELGPAAVTVTASSREQQPIVLTGRTPDGRTVTLTITVLGGALEISSAAGSGSTSSDAAPSDTVATAAATAETSPAAEVSADPTVGVAASSATSLSVTAQTAPATSAAAEVGVASGDPSAATPTP
jgi:hypothetical protein